MVNFDKLIPFIKKALENSGSVSPEEVMAVLQEGESSSPLEDQNAETVDSEMMDRSEQTHEEVKNEEGKLMESAFKDLDVEEAIKTVQERKEVEQGSDQGELIPKTAWDLLKAYANNCR